MNKADLIALGAVLRRAGIAIGVSLLVYAADLIPQAVTDALQSNPKTAVFVPLAIWIVEFIQKSWRERRKLPQ